MLKHSLPVCILFFSVILNSSCESAHSPHEEAPLTKAVPGQYMVSFHTPAEFENWDKGQRIRFTREMLAQVQDDYHISDEQVLARFRIVLSGFTAKLSDLQRIGLESDERIRKIENDLLFKGI